MKSKKRPNRIEEEEEQGKQSLIPHSRTLTPHDLCAEARRSWVFATDPSHLAHAEKLYRLFLVRARKDPSAYDPGDVEEARKRLFLLVCQAGRSDEIAPRMSRQGLTARLARAVLCYEECSLVPQMRPNKDIPCAVFDNALSKAALERLVTTFVPPDANYWTVHKYCVEPPTPFFSFVLPLADYAKYGAYGELAMAVKTRSRQHFGENVDKSVFAEIWAHNRPHACGHQMHFDSDDEGRNGIRNPLAGSIFYLGHDGVGGPSLVTDQPYGAQRLATQGWFCWPKTNRLLVFDGTMLHGVVPGKEFVADVGARRVTIMVALWATIRVRDGPGPGSARPLPRDLAKHTWLAGLMESPPPPSNPKEKATKATRMQPVHISPVWETLAGEAWDHGAMGMPGYDDAFQGF